MKQQQLLASASHCIIASAVMRAPAKCPCACASAPKASSSRKLNSQGRGSTGTTRKDEHSTFKAGRVSQDRGSPISSSTKRVWHSDIGKMCQNEPGADNQQSMVEHNLLDSVDPSERGRWMLSLPGPLLRSRLLPSCAADAIQNRLWSENPCDAAQGKPLATALRRQADEMASV